MWGSMPVIGRINWLERQIRDGRRGYITIGAALDPDKIKIKIMLQPVRNMRVAKAVSDGLAQTLSLVRELLSTHTHQPVLLLHVRPAMHDRSQDAMPVASKPF